MKTQTTILDPIFYLSPSNWDGPFSISDQESAIQALENGKILFFQNLPFKMNQEEMRFLTPNALNEKSKNISYDWAKKQIKGTSYTGSEAEQLARMLQRFSDQTQSLLNALFPYYKSNLSFARTSYRPAQVAGRKSSYRKDDTLLHVDAFPSSPTHGQRIIRTFSNINPNGESRHWRLGEPFQNVAKRFMPQISSPFLGSRAFLKFFKVTKSYRTSYDHYMLHLHDKMKADQIYQKEAPQIDFHFPPGTSWIVMTDVASHAAMGGRYLLEQTCHLPVSGMKNQEVSPLFILEKMTGKRLI